ncbi:MAG: hypothetical protein IKB75_01630 [Clostridia bacterium]|nr:hypothetical protein [Clostridia bacterium]
MKHNTQTTAWQQYEAGKEYKRRIGLYERVHTNERFYRGDQWSQSDYDLPRPVFNVVRRITDYLVGAVLPEDVSIHYVDDKLPFLESSVLRETVQKGLCLLERNASYRWKQNHMNALAYQALLNAALTGDGIFYCYWDDQVTGGQPYLGDIRVDCIDNTALFVADVDQPELQRQDYVMLAGRAPVTSLRREALEAGLSHAEAQRITADDTTTDDLLSSVSTPDVEGAEKATYLLRFFRENGEVICEKSTKTCVLRRFNTGLRHYPVAYFNWIPTKNCFHGTSPISDIIANQKFINGAYAMAMKHMRDTAFSKVIYDKSRIPEWSNEVGEAIAANGGGSVADAISVVGVGKMQDGYLALLNNVIENTKAMMGATESALGDAEANNTSAILALQEASRVGLAQVTRQFCRCIGELATIWADMICTYCPNERLLPILAEDGVRAERADYRRLRDELISAVAEVGKTTRYTPASTVLVLDKLLEGGYLELSQYLRLLPPGSIAGREQLIQEIQNKGALENE